MLLPQVSGEFGEAVSESLVNCGLHSPAGSWLTARVGFDLCSLRACVSAKRLPARPAESWVLRTSRACWWAREGKRYQEVSLRL